MNLTCQKVEAGSDRKISHGGLFVERAQGEYLLQMGNPGRGNIEGVPDLINAMASSEIADGTWKFDEDTYTPGISRPEFAATKRRALGIIRKTCCGWLIGGTWTFANLIGGSAS